MFGWLVQKRLAAFEKAFDYDMEYVRDIYSASPRAFSKFSKIFGLSEYREDVPLTAWFAAQIAATLAGDCGPCTQLVVSMAERRGGRGGVVRAVVSRDCGWR